MKRFQINLIQQKKKDFTDKVIYFFLHYLRYIIVITQIVVIGTFFFRFYVDQEIIDLKENIQQKEEIFKVTRPLVNEVIATEKSTNNIKLLLLSQEKFLTQVDYLLSVIPSEITLDDFIIDEKSISIRGESANVVMIKTLNDRIKKDGKFKTVAISQIAKSENGFSFSIGITN